MRPKVRARPGRARQGPAGGRRGRPGDPRKAALGRLAREIQTCQLCPLGRTRTRAVVYRGSTSPRAVFVGEAPGAEEDRQGLPFVGRSGRILDRAIATLGEDLGPFGVLNVIKCRPPQNRFDPGAARACRPYLERQLALLAPAFLVPLGAKALRALSPSAPPILVSAGHELPSSFGPVFPLVHPAATLRSRRLADRWRDDLEVLRAWLRERPR